MRARSSRTSWEASVRGRTGRRREGAILTRTSTRHASHALRILTKSPVITRECAESTGSSSRRRPVADTRIASTAHATEAIVGTYISIVLRNTITMIAVGVRKSRSRVTFESVVPETGRRLVVQGRRVIVVVVIGVHCRG